MDEAAIIRTLADAPPADPRYRPGLDLAVAGSRPEALARPSPARARVRLAASLAVGLALLLAALLMGGLLPAGPSPRPIDPTFGPYLPAVIPEGIPTGTVETPLGEARWVHLVGEWAEVFAPVVPGPSGLLLGHATGSEGGGLQLQASDDGLVWTSRQLPIEAESGTLTLTGGSWWLTSSGPTSLWRSDDAASWAQVDLSRLEAPEPTDLDWELLLGTPTSTGEVTVIPVSHRVRDASRLLGMAPTYRQRWPQEVTAGHYDVIEGTPRGAFPVGAVRIEEAATGLQVLTDDGSPITVLEGVGLDFIRAWTARGSIERHGIGLVEDDAVTLVAQMGLAYPDVDAIGAAALLATSGGFRAFATTPEGSLIRSWSDDGIRWSKPNGQGEIAHEVRSEIGYGHRDRVRALGDPDRATTDGLTWDTTPGLVVDGGELRVDPSDGGALPADPDWTTLTIAPDGGAPVPLVIPGLSVEAPRDQPWDSVQSVVGNTVFVMNLRTGPPEREAWIIELEPTLE